jgi:transposase
LSLFNKIFAELAGKGGKLERITIDATHLNAHRTAASILKKARSPAYRAHQRRPERQVASRLQQTRPAHHALQSEGQMSDYKAAALVLPATPKPKLLLADKRYDADWFRAALAKRGAAACIPWNRIKKSRSPYEAVLYKHCHKIKTCSGVSKTGGASAPDTTAAPTPTCRQSASPQPPSFTSLTQYSRVEI